MNNTQLMLDDLIIQVIRKPIKHMYVRITPTDGQVSVSVPLRASLELIHQQLISKKEWILNRRTRLQKQLPQQYFKGENSDGILFLGKNYLLITEQTDKKSNIAIKNDSIVCHINPTTTASETLRILNTWYKKELMLLLPALIAKWQSIIGVRINNISTRTMKTRWGSCNTRTKSISLNLNLIKKPLICIEYVLVHEMVHLLEASHNHRFYALMTQFMPNWRDHQSLLEPNRHFKGGNAC